MLKGTALETSYYRFLERYLVPVLIAARLKPNHVSLIGFLTSILAGVSFAFSPPAGGICTLLAGLLDTLDGSLARSLGESRKDGAFLDSVLDRYAELIIYLGIWAYFYRSGGAVAFISVVMLLILFGSLMVSYTRARAEGLGERCLGGFFQRGERIILVSLAGILNPLANMLIRAPDAAWHRDILLVLALLALAVGANLTALWRFWSVLNSLRH